MAAAAAGLSGLGPDKPNWARISNYWLGGYDNFGPDRAEAEGVERVVPEIRNIADANRRFAAHAVRRAVTGAEPAGQVVELGSGFPPSMRAHEAARSVQPGARVAYVDADLEVVDQLLVSLAGVIPAGVTAVRADLTDPETALGLTGAVIDLDRPVCLLLTGVLHMMTPALARDLVADYAGRIAAGSWVVISVPRFEGSGTWRKLCEMTLISQLHNFTPDEFSGLFGAMDVASPGLGRLNQLGCVTADRPARGPGRAYVMAGAARKLLRVWLGWRVCRRRGEG